MALTTNLTASGIIGADSNINTYSPPDTTITAEYNVKTIIAGSTNSSGQINLNTYFPPDTTITAEYDIKAVISGSATTSSSIVVKTISTVLPAGSIKTNSDIVSTSVGYNGIISGLITDGGQTIEGAKLYLINTTDDVLVATTNSDGSGQYEFDNLNPQKTYHVVVEYQDGDAKYNAESLPFVKPV